MDRNHAPLLCCVYIYPGFVLRALTNSLICVCLAAALFDTGAIWPMAGLRLANSTYFARAAVPGWAIVGALVIFLKTHARTGQRSKLAAEGSVARPRPPLLFPKHHHAEHARRTRAAELTMSLWRRPSAPTPAVGLFARCLDTDSAGLAGAEDSPDTPQGGGKFRTCVAAAAA